MAITVTLAAPRTETAPAFYGIETGDEIVEAAARYVPALNALTRLGLTVAQAFAALKVAHEKQTITVVVTA